MLQDYSGFYYNVSGEYENIVYYISPGEDQKLYMIRKYDSIMDTNAVLKSIETGFNGYNYEIYGVKLLSKPFVNPDIDDEQCVLVEFEDFSNKQVFDGCIIVPESMPMFMNLYKYLTIKAFDLPLMVHTGNPNNELPMDNEQPQQEGTPVQQETSPVEEQEEVFEEIEEPKPKTFNEQLMTPQQRAIEDSQTLAFQIVQNNEGIDKEDNEQ